LDALRMPSCRMTAAQAYGLPRFPALEMCAARRLGEDLHTLLLAALDAWRVFRSAKRMAPSEVCTRGGVCVVAAFRPLSWHSGKMRVEGARRLACYLPFTKTWRALNEFLCWHYCQAWHRPLTMGDGDDLEDTRAGAGPRFVAGKIRWAGQGT
jgi:hypothetical protein